MRRVLWVPLVLLSVLPVQAEPILYRFDGVADATSDPFVAFALIDPDQTEVLEITPWWNDIQVLDVATNGALGAYEFDGSADIRAVGFLDPDDGASGRWIARTPVSGPTVNNLTPVHLEIYIHFNPGMPASALPPEVGNSSFSLWLADDSEQLFAIDGQITGVTQVAVLGTAALDGRIADVTQVPEPGTAALMGVAVLAGIARRRWTRPVGPARGAPQRVRET